MQSIIHLQNVGKTYSGGFVALKNIDLHIKRGEIFALLGPNGAGKTTLINTICGIINMTSGSITVDSFDIMSDYRKTRSLIGLVPQELFTDAFETVWDTVNFSRGVFGKPKNPEYIKKILTDFSLWEKRQNKIITLSGGMKRRVMIAKALSHEPDILFLDEPTAGVDVELRKDMWEQVRILQSRGVTIILTTHYIEEAEHMADRIAIIHKGSIIVTEKKQDLMKKLGKKRLIIDLNNPLVAIPPSLASWPLSLENEGSKMIYTYDATNDKNGISKLLSILSESKISYSDLHTKQSSLEDIFIELVKSS